MSGGSEEKALPPTVRKLRDARRRGEIPRSKELVTAVVTAMGCGLVLMNGGSAVRRMAGMLSDSAALESRPFAETANAMLAELAWTVASIAGPVLLVLVFAAILGTIIATGGLVISAQPVMPKLDRINPVAGFGRLFSLRSLTEIAKNVLKLVAVVAVGAVLLRAHADALARTSGCSIACIPPAFYGVLAPFLIACSAIFLILGLLDTGLQRLLFRRDMRMTKTEHKRDRKDAEGNPLLRSKRRQERRDIARIGARMGLKNATFLVQSDDGTLAFRYAPPDATVPILVARGGRQTCRQLAAGARQLGLPVVYDPEAMKALLPQSELGKMVPKTAFMPIIQCMKAAGIIG